MMLFDKLKELFTHCELAGHQSGDKIEPSFYVVLRNGDTAEGLAKAFTHKVARAKELGAINPDIKDLNDIKAGESIHIPASWILHDRD